MIQVKQLTKVYKSRKSGNCVALDGVSFTLPDKGFVFIIGKSGSGKTTLLSLLGGLDSITSGEIIENGKHIEKFSINEQVYYRNSTIGFIFQDFHLIDELTIYENIALALELRGESDDEKVQRALESTGIADQKDKYPNELSGGQKQRVAIARALVKQPSVILADEPTGNLDSKTTVQILDLLKALSAEKLVVIVSHNLSDAERYADEIIELSSGKILQHVKRNENFDSRLRVEGDELVIPYGEKFSNENLREVAEEMESRPIKSISQSGDRFVPYQDGAPIEETPPIPLEKKGLKAKSTAKLAVRFARKGVFRSVIYAVVFAIVLSVLGLSQLLMSFDGGKALIREMNKRNMSCASFIKTENLDYESVDPTRIVDVNDGDLQQFYDAGYDGKIYPFVNYSLYLWSDAMTIHQKRISALSTNPYGIGSTLGVLIMEESFVEKRFGKLEYAALAEEQKDYGVYVTDFFADACVINHPKEVSSYDDVLGVHAAYTKHRYGYINGIIKTDYKQRYQSLIDRLTDPNMTDDDLEKLVQTDECLAFYDEVCQYLAIAYSFDQDFVEKALPSAARQFVSAGISTFEYGGKTYDYTNSYYSSADMRNSVPLGDNEIIMNYNVYNEIFGTNYTPQNLTQFAPHEVKFTYYMACDQNKSRKKYETTLTIIGIAEQHARVNIADNVLADLKKIEMCTMGYYFDNVDDMDIIANVAAEIGYLPNSTFATAMTTMIKVVEVFRRFFDLIFAALGIMLFLLIVQYELKNIRDRLREIGILKAIGTRDRDVMAIFGFQVAAVILLMAALYIAGAFAFTEIANKILAFSLAELSKNIVVTNLSFLSVNWLYVLANCAFALVLFIVSFFVPMLRLRHIKPTNVIKAKE